MTMTSLYADTDYHNHDDDDNDWLCIILAGYQLLMATAWLGTNSIINIKLFDYIIYLSIVSLVCHIEC